MYLKYQYGDGCTIESLKNGNVIVKLKSDSYEFSDKNKPIYQNELGETVIEYTGLGVDGNQEQSWAIATYAPGGHSLCHFHQDRTETYYIISGKPTVILNGEAYHLSAGDHLTIHSKSEHQVINNSTDSARLIVKCKPAWISEDFHLVTTNSPKA